MASVFSADATPDVVTAPQGYITWELTQNTVRLFSVPLWDTPEAIAVVAGLTGDTLSVGGAPWNSAQFTGTPYALQIVTGAQQGRWLLLAANSTNSVTAQVGGRPFNVPGFAVTVGDRFEIVRADTLASLFGNTDAELLLQGGATSLQADLAGQFDGQQWTDYFYRIGHGWRRVDAPDTETNPPPLLPGSPIRLTRRGPAKTLILTGRVPMTRILMPVTASTTPLGWPFPVESPLASLVIGGPDSWKKGSTAETSDWLSLPEMGGTFRQGTSGAWVAVAGSPVTNVSNARLPSGGGFYLAKQGGATGLHAIDPPYTAETSPSPTPGPTPAPTPPPPAVRATYPPILRVTSRRSFRTSATSATIRGTSTARGKPVVRVQCKWGGRFHQVSGLARWRKRVRLKMGRNVFRFRAVDNLGRSSSLVRVTITRTSR